MSSVSESVTIPIEMDRLQVNNLKNDPKRNNRRTPSPLARNIAATDAENLDPDFNNTKSKAELDDDELDVEAGQPQPGVDDGFFPQTKTDQDDNNPANGLMPRRRRPSFIASQNPNYPGAGVNTVVINGVSQPVPDYNLYQQKKILAQGMLDLALLSANANQLRYVLESYNRHPYYYPSVIFISLSIIFQVAVGIGLIINSRHNVEKTTDLCKANKINNYTVIGVFVVTVVNVFISAFGVASPEAST